MITLRQEFDPRAGGQSIWIALCLTVLVLAVVGSVRMLRNQEENFRFRRVPETLPQTTALIPGGDREEQSCEDLLGRDGAGWTVGQTAVPAVFVVQPGTATPSIWLGRQEHRGGSSGSSYSSVWQDVLLPAYADSLILAWSWRLQTSEEPAVAPGAGSDRQQALLLDDQGALLEVMHSARAQTLRVTEQRYDLSPYAGETVRIYFNAYNDGNSQPTSLRLDRWALRSCRTVAVPTGGTVDRGDVGSAPVPFSGRGSAAQGFGLWLLSLLTCVALAGVGWVENARSRNRAQR